MKYYLSLARNNVFPRTLLYCWNKYLKCNSFLNGAKGGYLFQIGTLVEGNGNNDVKKKEGNIDI